MVQELLTNNQRM
ncbi:Putative uncharacterized protein [Lactococcus lactis subsp. lactis A12]|uniref:Uncharacterized protein n=1 Tax=Lactococcus lactis subsp. lactis A12 TaxID=1137134 RepID=S6FU86_LACLL|nr:Putative uncharacterized protein [Lactococcus lactis subsp. lactis A12]SBW29242.1 Hypothetical protein LLA12_00060 [Lactococcus lactis subsp. lactis]